MIQNYVRAHSLQEALSLYEQSERPVRWLAGGTDLFLKLPLVKSAPVTVVDISDVPELLGIEPSGAGLRIGAATKMADVARSPLMTAGYEILAQGALVVGSPQIRNLATLGGNLCNASPSADTSGPLLCLDAEARLVSARGERTVPLTEFFLGPGKTVMEEGELMTSLRLPAPPTAARGCYIRHTVRAALDLAIVGVSVLLARLDGVPDTRIALWAVAPTPIRASEAEEFLKQTAKLDNATIREAARLAQEAARPISDIRGSAAYRKEMVGRLTDRALRQASAALA